MSHSSLIATNNPEVWLAHEAIDRDNPYLRDKRGNPVTFAELEQGEGRRYASQATVQHITPQVRQTRAAVDRLRDEVAAHQVDVLVVFGDDQMELHDLDNMPALAVYYGDELRLGTGMRFASYEAELGGDVSTMMSEYAMDAPHVFPGHSRLGLH
jgi:3-O-methylgallate 3,4-dioxygenase